jgi:hypothetical protein
MDQVTRSSNDIDRSAPVCPPLPPSRLVGEGRGGGDGAGVRGGETIPNLARRALLCLAAVALGWLTIVHSLSSYLARGAPERALWLNPRQPDALLKLAEVTLAAEPATGPSTAPDATQRDADVRRLALRALEVNPLEARAFALLAELAERNNDRAGANDLRQAAIRRSLREPNVIYRLIIQNMETGKLDHAAALTDLLLRTEPDTYKAVLPVLVQLSETDAGLAALTTILTRNPEWRPLFFTELPGMTKNTRAPQELLLRLKDTANPPNNVELRSYLNFLLQNNLSGLAYYTWLQFTPPEHFDTGSLLFNGHFTRQPTGLAFDWVVHAGAGVNSEIVRRPNSNGDNGLNLEFGGGRIDFHAVAQALVLPPGRYRFTGRHKGRLVGQRGLRWRLSCGGKEVGAPLLETPMLLGLHAAWVDFDFAFTVPDQLCRGQNLQLIHESRSPSEQMLTGSVWYKDLEIRRVASAPK